MKQLNPGDGLTRQDFFGWWRCVKFPHVVMITLQVGIMTHMMNNIAKFCEADGVEPCRPPTTPLKMCVSASRAGEPVGVSFRRFFQHHFQVFLWYFWHDISNSWVMSVVWNMLDFYIYWEFHHPNWRTPIFQGGSNHHPRWCPGRNAWAQQAERSQLGCSAWD